MNISNVAAVTVVLLVFYVGIRYCIKLLRKEISPRIATWLIFEIGVVMSLASYLAGSDHSLIKAALNAADCIQVTVILFTLLIEQRGRKIQFTKNESVSLCLSGIAAAAWMITKTGWIGFIGFQSVMSVAYLPTIESLLHWHRGTSPEPMEKWGINVFIALIGLIVDITGQRDYLAMVYPLRALILCVLVVVLIRRWEQKSKADIGSIAVESK
jgi:uncharacterized membrane protein YkvI